MSDDMIELQPGAIPAKVPRPLKRSELKRLGYAEQASADSLERLAEHFNRPRKTVVHDDDQGAAKSRRGSRNGW